MPETQASSETQVITPQQRYSALLGSYTESSEAIRSLRDLPRTQDQIQKTDQRRHALHNRLREVAKEIGKSEEDLWLDMLSDQGNLKEYGVDAPLIKLPMVGVYFHGDHATKTIARPREQTAMDKAAPYAKIRNMHSLRTATGESLVSVMPPPQGYEQTQNEKITGNRSEIEKWDTHPYFMILYSDAKRDYHGEYEQPLHDLRMIRMRRLARDFDLNLIDTYDLSGHNNFGEHIAYGVEVPEKKVAEIGQAIGTQRQRYWLTEQELKHPEEAVYKEEDITDLSSTDALSALHYAQKRAATYNTWQSWKNVILIYKQLIKTGWKPPHYAPIETTWRLGPQHGVRASMINPSEKISEAIKTLQEKQPDEADSLQADLQEIHTFHEKMDADQKNN